MFKARKSRRSGSTDIDKKFLIDAMIEAHRRFFQLTGIFRPAVFALTWAALFHAGSSKATRYPREITDVTEKSPAAQFGIVTGDEIVTIDGKPANQFTSDQV